MGKPNPIYPHESNPLEKGLKGEYEPFFFSFRKPCCALKSLPNRSSHLGAVSLVATPSVPTMFVRPGTGSDFKVRSTGPEPVLNPKTADLGKRALIVGHKRMAEGEGVRGNQEIIAANRRSGLLEAVSDGAVGGVDPSLEREYLDSAEYRFELGRERRRVFPGGGETQLGRHNDAGANVGFADAPDAIENLAARMSDEVNEGLNL